MHWHLTSTSRRWHGGLITSDACVSTWLNGGVAPTRVAEWAGHSVAVLLQIYAKCIAGQEDMARKRIESALGIDPPETDRPTDAP